MENNLIQAFLEKALLQYGNKEPQGYYSSRLEIILPNDPDFQITGIECPKVVSNTPAVNGEVSFSVTVKVHVTDKPNEINGPVASQTCHGIAYLNGHGEVDRISLTLTNINPLKSEK